MTKRWPQPLAEGGRGIEASNNTVDTGINVLFRKKSRGKFLGGFCFKEIFCLAF